MSRSSQYNVSLEYSETKCLVTFITKSGNWASHAMLAFEGKGIAPNGENLLVFDFMQKAKAVQLAENEEKNRQSILASLIKLTRDMLVSETARKLATEAYAALSSRASLYQVTSVLLKKVMYESKDVADYVSSALLTSSTTVTNSVLSLFIQDVGVIRSSHPLDAKNPMQKIREWESTASMKDIHCTLQVSRDELNKIIAKIRSEEPSSRPFQFLGSQQTIWNGCNCLDWILEKLRMIPLTFRTKAA